MSISKYSKNLSLLTKLALMLLIFWFVAEGVDMQEVDKMLRLQNRSAFIWASFFFMVQVALGAVRWRAIMVALAGSGARVISYLQAFRFFYISVFFNCCLPGTVGGDVVRVWLIKSENVPLPLAINSVVIDRMIALLALGVMGGLTMPVLAGYIDVSAWLITPVYFLLVALGMCGLFHLDTVIARVKTLGKLQWIEFLVQNIRQVISCPKAGLWSLFYAIISHVSYCMTAYILAESLGNPISFLDCVTLIPWVLLISIIPVSIGGWGLREAAMVFFLGLIGVPQEAALTLSIQLGLLAIVTSVPAGFLWLVNRGQRSEVRCQD